MRGPLPFSIFLSLLLISFFLSPGCGTRKQSAWDGRIGHYTYDQAILDLGPPDKSESSPEGFKVLEWLENPAGPYRRTFKPDYYRRSDGTLLGRSGTISENATSLRLAFDSGGRLKTWSRRPR